MYARCRYPEGIQKCTSDTPEISTVDTNMAVLTVSIFRGALGIEISQSKLGRKKNQMGVLGNSSL